MVVGDEQFYLKFWINQPRRSEIADFNRYSLVAPQPQHQQQKFNQH